MADKRWIRWNDGKLSMIVECDNGVKIELPITDKGEIKWFDDSKLIKK